MTRDRFVRYIEINEAFHAGLWRLAKSPMLRASIERIVALPFAAPGALVFSWPDSERGNIEAVIAIRATSRAGGSHRAARRGTRARLSRANIRALAQRALETRAWITRESFEKLPGATLVRAG
jgi:GntR family transcriptional regulator of vanillate catabolism